MRILRPFLVIVQTVVRCLERYSLGDMPVAFLKILENANGSG